MRHFFRDTYDLELSSQERIIVGRVAARAAGPAQLLDILGYEDGAVEDRRARSALRALVSRARAKLQTVGYTITTQPGGRGNHAVYRIEKVTDAAA